MAEESKMQYIMGKLEYIPIILISTALIIENQIEKHAFKTVCDSCIRIAVILLFFVLITKVGVNKWISLGIVSAVWILLIFCKNRILC